MSTFAEEPAPGAAGVPPASPDAPPAPSPVEPPLLPPPPAAAPPEPAGHPFLFHGDTHEYFRLWIVNTLLTLLTGGLYLAWAKVRKRRYLRGNTELLGHRFDYRADPRRILAGNILVALAFVAYMVFGEVYPMVRIVTLLLGLLLLPWVVVRSLAFNAHNTTYRGLRFHSRLTYGWTAIFFLGQWLLIIVTLGFYYPAWARNRTRLTVDSHGLGDAFFRFDAPAGPFYSAYLVGGGMVAIAAMIGGLCTGLAVAWNHGKPPSPLQLAPFLVVYGFALFLSKHFIFARLFNEVWNRTRLDEHRFVATLDTGRWIRLQLVHAGAIIGTAGLLYPWAVIRSARFALGHLRFVPAGPIENISRLRRPEGSALGETAAEFVGVDFGL